MISQGVVEKRRERPAKPGEYLRRDRSSQLMDLTVGRIGVYTDGRLDPVELIHQAAAPSELWEAESASSFRLRYWAAEMWSKFPFELESVNRESAALDRFFEAEELCRQANSRLTDAIQSRPIPDSILGQLRKARRRLHWLLSDITPSEVMQRAGWGPGATTSMVRRLASKQNKWEFAAHSTESALPWVQSFWKGTDWPNRKVEVVLGNKVTTVPKNAKTDRVIAIEPDWNMFFQKGLGRAIRCRLHRVGLLRDRPGFTAQNRNQDLARAGSSGWGYGTIDLSMASDTVSLALCEQLLPSSVLAMMLSLRSDCGLLPNGLVGRYEKISSMGNGFTFELETALFWALGSAVTEAGVVCYGDDIIVPDRDSGLRLIELLEFCGFRVNPKKTFLEGPFRESCGGHYFKGTDVTPPYFKKPLDSLMRFAAAANSLVRRCDFRTSLDNRLFAEAWRDLASRTPRRFRGPRSAGDSVLWMPFDSCTPQFDPNLQVHFGECLRFVPGTTRAPEWGALRTALHGQSVEPAEEYDLPQFGTVVRSYWYAPRWSYSDVVVPSL